MQAKWEIINEALVAIDQLVTLHHQRIIILDELREALKQKRRDIEETQSDFYGREPRKS